MTSRARTTDPDTSHEAADSVADLREKQQAVLSLLRLTRVPMEDQILVEVYGIMADSGYLPKQSQSGIRTRRKELADLGLVVDSGKRTTLPSGRQAILWQAAAQ